MKQKKPVWRGGMPSGIAPMREQMITKAKGCLFCIREKCGVACPVRRHARDTVYRLLQSGISESDELRIGVKLWSMLGATAPTGEMRGHAPGHYADGAQVEVICPHKGKPLPQAMRDRETHCARCCAAWEEEIPAAEKKDI